MIDPKELRLGNYIKPVGKWECCPLSVMRVNSVQYDHVIRVPVSKIGWIVGDVEDFEPIPLTDAVLEACGFEKDYPIYKVPHESLSHIEKNGYKQTKDYGKWLWFNKYGDMEACVGAPFQYLHQLQNLYFALTGVDLEIDETKLKQALC